MMKNEEQLSQLKKQYEELTVRLQEPETWQRPEVFSACQKEAQGLAPIVEAYERYLETEAALSGVAELMEDPELRDLAREERHHLLIEQAAIEDELQMLLLPEDPDAGKNVIIEIRSGVGGEESALFAADLYRMYAMYADTQGWKIELLNVSHTELGGVKEVVFLLNGRNAFSRMKYEGGGHRVQRVPVTESGGRIHTSAATVAVLPQIDEAEFKLNLNELKIDTFRSSGAGGQHVNKTESAIRITHLPSGLVVECQDERSQYKNKDRALSVMRSKLYELDRKQKQDALAAERKSQIGSGDRSDRIRTYNFPQNRVTDHRLSGDGRSFNLESIMNGNLDPLLDALALLHETEKRMGER